MTPMNVRGLELARGPRNHNIKALKKLFESHEINEEDSLAMAFRVSDLHGPFLNSTPSAFLYETALDQLAFYREMHIS